jgi:hypothetical protein
MSVLLRSRRRIVQRTSVRVAAQQRGVDESAQSADVMFRDKNSWRLPNWDGSSVTVRNRARNNPRHSDDIRPRDDSGNRELRKHGLPTKSTPKTSSHGWHRLRLQKSHRRSESHNPTRLRFARVDIDRIQGTGKLWSGLSAFERGVEQPIRNPQSLNRVPRNAKDYAGFCGIVRRSEDIRGMGQNLGQHG